MTVALSSRADFTLENYWRVAWSGEDARIEGIAVRVMTDSRRAFFALIDSGVAVYGTTTESADQAWKSLSPAEMADQGRRPLPESLSWGEPLPSRVVRGVIFARVANWIEGHGAVRPELADEVLNMLNLEQLPLVPGEGNGGAGEILALKHLFRKLSIEFGTELKEPMSLINGSPCAASLIADAALRARRRLFLAHQVFGLSIEGALAPLEAYDPELRHLWGDTGETAALKAMAGLLAGGAPERATKQAPVSFRIVPKLLGRAHRATSEAERAARISLRSVSDNPVFLPPTADRPQARSLSTGGFHNALAYPAFDQLSAAWADLAQLCERQTERYLAPLERGEGEDLLSGLAMVQSYWGEKARAAAQSTVVPLSGLGQNDTPAPNFFAWEKEVEAGRCLDASLGVLAVLATDEIVRSGRSAPPMLTHFFERIRGLLPSEVTSMSGSEALAALSRDFQDRVTALTDPWDDSNSALQEWVKE